MNTLGKSRKKAMLASLDELAERMPSLLDIDHPCAQRHIEEARHAVEVRSYFYCSWLFNIWCFCFSSLKIGVQMLGIIQWFSINS